MRTETVTRTIVEEDELVFVPAEARSITGQDHVGGRVCKVIEATDEDGDVYVESLTGKGKGYYKATELKPWVEDDPDHDRVFIFDQAGWDAVPDEANLVDQDGDTWFLADGEREWAPTLLDWVNYGPLEVLNPEVLDAPRFSAYSLSDEIEGPVFVFDQEGLDALPSYSVIVPDGYVPFFKDWTGEWIGFGSKQTHPDIVEHYIGSRAADVVFIADNI